MFKNTTGFFLLVSLFVVPLFAIAEDLSQELYISPAGDIRLIGKVNLKNASNSFQVDVWGLKWDVFVDYDIRVESTYGEKIEVGDIDIGHIVEIKGRPATTLLARSSRIDPKLIRDLSIKTGTPPPAAEIKTASLPLATELIKQLKIPVQKKESEESSESLTRTLRFGMRGKDVSLLQEFLGSGGVNIPNDWIVTGYFGRATEKALKDFQKARGLDALGITGPKTRAIINSLLTNKKETSTVSKSTISANKSIIPKIKEEEKPVKKPKKTLFFGF